MSVDAMSELQKISEALLACEEEIAGVKKAAEAKDPSAKNNLAQIEARLNKLEGRNDAVRRFSFSERITLACEVNTPFRF